MEQLEYGQVEVREELAYRIVKNYARLEGPEYRPDKIFGMGKRWPGDWEGRTRLAWVMLARISGRKPAYLAAVDALLDRKLNARHYFCNILPEGMADEQQVSGHNWFLRSLLEEYLWTGAQEAAQRAIGLVENLYLPLKGMYEKYPIQPDDRNKTGKASGHIEGEPLNGWYLSTDIGCAFMPLDGLSQYYEIFRDSRVADLLEEMAASIKRIDLVSCSMQTHAALSAARGLIRYYQCCGRQELLAYVAKLFDTYMEYGMTENYANYNWFCKPAWTEPCAIVDSYLLALELYKETGMVKYVQVSNRIFYNALSHAQRENGGFGCDNCAGSADNPDILAVYPECFEAFWCCSMRGGEGLAKAAAQAVLKDGPDFLFLNYVPLKYTSEELVFSVSTQYPYWGEVVIWVEGISVPTGFKFYIPQGTRPEEVKVLVNDRLCPFRWEGGLLCVILTGNGVVRLEFPIALHTEGPVSPKLRSAYTALWYGDLMLGYRTGAGEKARVSLPEELGELRALEKGRFRLGASVLEPVGGSIYHDKENMIAFQFQILYPINRRGSIEILETE